MAPSSYCAAHLYKARSLVRSSLLDGLFADDPRRSAQQIPAEPRDRPRSARSARSHCRKCPARGTTNGPIRSGNATSQRSQKSRNMTWSSGPYSATVGTGEGSKNRGGSLSGRAPTRALVVPERRAQHRPRPRTARAMKRRGLTRERPRRRPEARAVELLDVAARAVRRRQLRGERVGVAALAHEVVARPGAPQRDGSTSIPAAAYASGRSGRVQLNRTCRVTNPGKRSPRSMMTPPPRSPPLATQRSWPEHVVHQRVEIASVGGEVVGPVGGHRRLAEPAQVGSDDLEAGLGERPDVPATRCASSRASRGRAGAEIRPRPRAPHGHTRVHVVAHDRAANRVASRDRGRATGPGRTRAGHYPPPGWLIR